MSAQGKHSRHAGIAVVLIAALLGTTSAQAAKFYRWVDENGQVHFSQTPPPEVQKKGISAVSNDRTVLSVTRKGDSEYCGKLGLPGPIGDTRRILSKLSGSEERGRESLERSEERLEDFLGQQASKRNYGGNKQFEERRQDLINEKEQYRCALAWARKQREGADEVRDSLKSELEQSKQRHQALREEAYDRCGHDPKERKASTVTAAEHTAWNKCMRRYNSPLRSAEREVDRLQRDYQSVAQ